MDRMHGAWHNNLINVGLSVFDDGGIRRGKEFASEALFRYVVDWPQFIPYRRRFSGNSISADGRLGRKLN